MIIKPGDAKLPALHGRLMVDTFQGKVRVRSWPKKRGTPKSEAVRIQNDRFAQAQRLAKTAPWQLVNRLIDATQGTGLYPRDVLTKLMLRGVFDPVRQDGVTLRHYRPQVRAVSFQGFSLRLTSPQSAPDFTNNYPDWPTPELDTADFWDVTNPSYVTIPDGVDWMIFNAGFLVESSTNYSASIDRDLVSNPTGCLANFDNSQGCLLSTGPVFVQAGERWGFRFRPSHSRTFQPLSTFFNGIIISTDF